MVPFYSTDRDALRSLWLPRADDGPYATDIARGYKGLYEAERGWRDLKSSIDLRPVYHRREDRIRNELERMHLVTLATSNGGVAQRSELTPGRRSILRALELPEPPPFFDFTLTAE